MKEIIFLQPVFKEAIWGGNKLRKIYDYDISSETTGEAWCISAHDNGDCKITNGLYKGQTLSWLWDNHRELFGNLALDRFPLLVKVIDAKKDLSIQVHPDDKYANLNENGSLGKTECWYILDCNEDSSIVLGHNANNKDELRQMIKDNRWADLIKVVKVKKGDFFQINPGTVHAIKGGNLILEIQQSSDITYRLYDYDRLEDGKPRQLHIDKSIDVIKAPHTDAKIQRKNIEEKNYIKEELISNKYYTVEKVIIKGKAKFFQDKKFLTITIINGQGTINGIQIKKGDNFILPSGFGDYIIEGELEFVSSCI